MTDHSPMQLENYYTCYIERRWHIPCNPPSARLATGLLVNNIDDCSGGSDVGIASGIDMHPDRTKFI